MTNSALSLLVPMASLGILIGVSAFAGAQTTVVVESGSVTFRSTTNVAGIEVKGSSNALTASADIEAGPSLAIHSVEASMPVRSLATGMKIRDEHMRRYIFTTASGTEPDLRFTANGAACPPSAQSHEFACRMSGSLTIRGVTKQIVLNLRVREQGASSFRVTGESLVKLSDFGIAPPVQLGVRASDDVELRLDFTGKKTESMPVPKAVSQ